MHASSCSSSLQENTVDPPIATRTREYLARLSIHDCSARRCCACLDSDRCEEPPERFELCACDFARGEYDSDKEASSGCSFRQ